MWRSLVARCLHGQIIWNGGGLCNCELSNSWYHASNLAAANLRYQRQQRNGTKNLTRPSHKKISLRSLLNTPFEQQYNGNGNGNVGVGWHSLSSNGWVTEGYKGWPPPLKLGFNDNDTSSKIYPLLLCPPCAAKGYKRWSPLFGVETQQGSVIALLLCQRCTTLQCTVHAIKRIHGSSFAPQNVVLLLDGQNLQSEIVYM